MVESEILPGSVVDILRTYPLEELQDRLRQVKLNSGLPRFFPYLRSEITLEAVEVEALHPSAFYVIEKILARTVELRNLFLEKGLDTFVLGGSQTIVDYGYQGQQYTISPPLVELSQDDGNVPVILDGLHRFFQARVLGIKKVNAVVIKNVAAPLPTLPVEWSDVHIWQTVPPEDKKRPFRFNTAEEIEQWWFSNENRTRNGFHWPDSLGCLRMFLTK